MSVQLSFLNQLIQNEESLDPCIVQPLDPRWNDAMREWDNADIFSLDSETYGEGKNGGLNPWKGKIRLIQVGLRSGLVIVVDLGGWKGCNEDHRPIISKQFLPRLKRYLKDPRKRVLGVNLKFDLLFYKVKWGFEARSCVDLMLMSQVLWAGLPIYHNLKAIAERLGIEVDKTQQMSEWGFPLNNNQLNYAAKDVRVLFDIFDKMRVMVQDAGLEDSVCAEMLALPGFVQFEYYGMPVDYKLLLQVLEKYHATTEQVLKPFSDRFPGINPDSSQQVVAAVNKEFNIFLDGTAQEYLAPYWDKPELKALSLWRTITTYIDYLENVKRCYFDGAVRGVYRQINPSGFGRSTCGADKKADRSAVNLQNPPNMMPEELRQYNLPPIRCIFRTEDEQLLISDLSSAHARIATEAAKDRKLIEIYNSGADLHSVTASGLAKQKGYDWDDKFIAKTRKDKSHPDNPECELLRQVAKPLFYGCVPMDTDALTRYGWKKYHELHIGDEILAFNPESNKNEWTPILALNYYEDAPLIRLKSGGGNRLNSFEDNDNGACFNVRVTPDHRWFGQKQRRVGEHLGYGKGFKSIYVDEFFKTIDIKKSDRILVAAQSDGGFGITEIPSTKYDFDWVCYILSMTPKERKSFLAGVLVSEGHITYSSSKSGKKGKYPSGWAFVQNPGNIADAMILAAFLEGNRISINYDKGTGKSRYNTLRIRLMSSNVVTGQKMNFVPSGSESVWCPTTKFGTWIMRQGNTITITGNSMNWQGWQTLQTTAQKESGVNLTDKDAKDAIKGWQTTYIDLYKFQQKTHSKTNSKKHNFEFCSGEFGEVRGLSNRRIYMPFRVSDFKPNDPAKVKNTDCVSFVWTSTEADIIKFAIGWFLLETDLHPEWCVKLRNMAHDELDVTCNKQYKIEVATCLQKHMRDAMSRYIKSIPPDDMTAKPESLLVNSWMDK